MPLMCLSRGWTNGESERNTANCISKCYRLQQTNIKVNHSKKSYVSVQD